MAGHTAAMVTGAGKHASFNLSIISLETSNGSESRVSKTKFQLSRYLQLKDDDGNYVNHY